MAQSTCRRVQLLVIGNVPSSAILENGNLNTYTPVAHGTVIVMKFATSNQPFNAVHNNYYKMEVEMLQPGIVVPHSTTVLQDINTSTLSCPKQFEAISRCICLSFFCLLIITFQSQYSAIHFAIDRWTVPLVASYLGIVIIWYEKGEIY